MKYKSIGLSSQSFNKDDVVNDWLKKNPNIKIVHVVQSQNADIVNLSIFYEN
jgi:hypothetical protein